MGVAKRGLGKASRLNCPGCGPFLIEQIASHSLYNPLYNPFSSLVYSQLTGAPHVLSTMPKSTNDRASLTSRILPQMTLSDGSTSSMTGPPPPMPHYLTAEGRAIKRFAVEGNAIRTSSVSRVLSARPTAIVRAPHADIEWKQ